MIAVRVCKRCGGTGYLPAPGYDFKVLCHCGGTGIMLHKGKRR